uniref:Uncharacterized protein n=1 Tax=Nelumbo nucifera TaxID=4432 RepID=A0A822YDA9_NELNU|nr:TPA_asm: hypothetical protein HUJ06_031591 [Nelumbo nucifera]
MGKGNCNKLKDDIKVSKKNATGRSDKPQNATIQGTPLLENNKPSSNKRNDEPQNATIKQGTLLLGNDKASSKGDSSSVSSKAPKKNATSQKGIINEKSEAVEVARKKTTTTQKTTIKGNSGSSQEGSEKHK